MICLTKKRPTRLIAGLRKRNTALAAPRIVECDYQGNLIRSNRWPLLALTRGAGITIMETENTEIDIAGSWLAYAHDGLSMRICNDQLVHMPMAQLPIETPEQQAERERG